jgi:ParB family chromosome partitioning protein
MSTKSEKPRLGRGLSSLMGTPVAVRVPEVVPASKPGTAYNNEQGGAQAKAATVVPLPKAPAAVARIAPAKPGGESGRGGIAEDVDPARLAEAEARRARVIESMNPSGRAVPSRGASQTKPASVAASATPSTALSANQPVVVGGLGGSGVPRGLVEIAVDRLVRGRFQPRRDLDEASLQRLAASIRASGVMQPIAVRELSADDDRRGSIGAARAGEDGAVYEVVAGERRWRAAMLAGLTHIPAVVSPLSDREAAEWAIVENVQREDLNTMDRAWGLRNLVEGFALQHAEVAERVGIDRSSVTNLLRLTELETSVQGLLREGALGLGHGKALLGATNGAEREKLAKLAASQKWTVRRLERAVGALGVGAGSGGTASPKLGGTVGRDPLRADAAIRELEKQLGEHLGTRVRIMTGASRTKGRVVMDFYSLEHFDGLMSLMGVEIKS